MRADVRAPLWQTTGIPIELHVQQLRVVGENAPLSKKRQAVEATSVLHRAQHVVRRVGRQICVTAWAEKSTVVDRVRDVGTRKASGAEVAVRRRSEGHESETCSCTGAATTADGIWG